MSLDETRVHREFGEDAPTVVLAALDELSIATTVEDLVLNARLSDVAKILPLGLHVVLGRGVVTP